MEEKYNLSRDNRDFSIASINGIDVWFTAKFVSSKLIRKMWPNQCIVGTIFAAKQSAVGIQRNWSTYLLNEFLVDAINVQEKGNPFNYSWILILISFVAWEESLDYQGVDVPVPCWGARYQNIWYDKENTQLKRDNNIEFYLQGEALRDYIRKHVRITEETVQWFRKIIIFSVKAHDIFLQLWQEPQKKWLDMQF